MIGKSDKTDTTSTPIRMTLSQARYFIKEEYKNTTHQTKEWVVKDISTNSNIHYNNQTTI